ncbi:MAG: hypothetical protein R3C53_20070 [Pirellulaceae bacterium]
MKCVRVLVGTAKGAFIFSSDEKREKWKVEGPLFAGWTVYHMKGSPVDPNRIYASQCSDWFGQVIQRSSDGGKTWEQPGTQKWSLRANQLAQVTNLFTKAKLERISGTTARRIHGNLNASGTSNRR